MTGMSGHNVVDALVHIGQHEVVPSLQSEDIMGTDKIKLANGTVLLTVHYIVNDLTERVRDALDLDIGDHRPPVVEVDFDVLACSLDVDGDDVLAWVFSAENLVLQAR